MASHPSSPRRLVAPSLCATALLAAIPIAGCIKSAPWDAPHATAIDPATTQPVYWLTQPSPVQVRATDFEAAVDAAKDVIRNYLFEVDRVDYRAGLVTSRPLVSKQVFEVWRPDTGTVGQALDNTLATIRRTIHVDIDRNPDQTFTLNPKVLVERLSLQERRLTDVVQYRQAFTGPVGSRGTASRAQFARDADEETDASLLPVRYWYATGRDTPMESEVAAKLRDRLSETGPTAGAAGGTPDTQSPPPAAVRLAPDGKVTHIGRGDELFVDLGAADKIVPGMTFEIYDAKSPLPTLDRYARVNPGAKAWVEVLTVGNASSTCRILSTTPGATRPATGDLLHNLVYARGARNRFAFVGDLAPNSRETLAGLIWRWNGIVDDRPTDRTTFLVTGPAPRDPAALDSYTGTLARAKDLNIPVLTEDQFNLFIRYYDPSRR
ncbi:MAG TPA: hypothetical protein VEA69_08615 [Tepidisphaeraceae bacterium]|nr:hypothetical protein [Tepidisphaeraceae bacterium]